MKVVRAETEWSGRRTSGFAETPMCKRLSERGDPPVKHEESERPGYLGAMLDEERRLVLVPLDPERPWVAFRRMRSWMKRSRKGAARSRVGVFTAPPGGDADMITLRPRSGPGREP